MNRVDAAFVVLLLTLTTMFTGYSAWAQFEERLDRQRFRRIVMDECQPKPVAKRAPATVRP